MRRVKRAANTKKIPRDKEEIAIAKRNISENGGKRSRHDRTSEYEMSQRILKVMELIFTGMPQMIIIDMLTRTEDEDGMGLTKAQASYATSKAVEWIQQDIARTLPNYRATQLARLHRDLARMRVMDPPPFTQIVQMERLISQIAGTQAPIRVQTFDEGTVMRQSLAKVLTDMTKEDFDRFRSRGREVITTGQSV